MNARRALRWLLLVVASAETLALGAVLVPEGVYVVVHRWLGLGVFAQGTIAGYLARHLSAMYVVHAGFLWLASTDVLRHGALIRYLGWSSLAFAPFIVWLDIRQGFPWFWIVCEGPVVAVLGCAFLLLERRVRADTAQRSENP